MNSEVLFQRAQVHLASAATAHDADERHYLTVEAVILCAAAVESEVNWTIARPILLVQDSSERMYAGHLAARVARASIREKIEFLLRSHDDFKLDGQTRTSLRTLFRLRNRFVHSTPELRELHFFPDDWDRWGEAISLDELPRRPVLDSGIDIEIEAISQVPDLISQAGDFIRKLRRLPPEVTFEETRDVP